MSKAVCTSCHFIFDSRIGIEESGIPPGTVFDRVDPSTFLCPHCGASHDQFIEVRDEILEPEDIHDLSEVEAEHLPYYFFEDEDLVVRVGYPDSEHPQEKEHRIEWIEIVDSE